MDVGSDGLKKSRQKNHPSLRPKKAQKKKGKRKKSKGLVLGQAKTEVTATSIRQVPATVSQTQAVR